MIRRIVALILAFAAPVSLIAGPAGARDRLDAATPANEAATREAGDARAGQAARMPMPVPEPAAWAMLIGGFGFAGLSLRRHRARRRVRDGLRTTREA